MNPDVILHNGKLITLEKDVPAASALGVSGGLITALGSDEEIKALAGAGTRMIDLKGKALLPGFIDTHVHFVSTGLRLRYMVDLTAARSVEDVLSLISRSAEDRPAGEWILGWGFDHSALAEKRYPTIEELDQRAPHHPVMLRRRDGHSCLLNSGGLARMEINSDTPGFGCDGQGRPTGVLQAQANSQASQHLGQLLADPSIGAEACRAAAQEAASVGLTTVHALTAGLPSDPEGMAIHRVEKQLPVRLVKYFQTTDIDAVLDEDLPRIGGCILLDGSMGSQTAALMEPYADSPEADGVLYFEQDEIDGFCLRANRAGLQIALHAIGDRAIQQALTAYERALADTPREDHRHRIEHFVLPTDEQMDWAASLGITLAMQPAFEHFWGGPEGLYTARLGRQRKKRTSPFRGLVDRGLIIGGGSDSLVTPMNPLLGIHSAVNHPNPDHRVSVREALEFFTVNGAYQSFEEGTKGSFSPGKVADCVILERDPASVPVEDIASIPVIATVVGGKVVHGEDDLNA